MLHSGDYLVFLENNNMKKLVLFAFVAILLSSCATNTSFSEFYKDHQEDSDFSFGISSSLVSSFLPDEDMEDIKPLLKKAKHVRILVFSEEAEDKTEQFDRFIKRSPFEKMVKVKDDDDKIAVFTLESKEKIKEIVLEISSGDELVLLGLKTNLTHEALEEMIQ